MPNCSPIPWRSAASSNRRSMPDTAPSTWVKPEWMAQLLLFLASEDAGELNGALIPVGSA